MKNTINILVNNVQVIVLFIFLLISLSDYSFAQVNYKITNAPESDINGIYVNVGTYGSEGYPEYKNTNGLFYVYDDYCGVCGTGYNYWNIDNNLDDEGDIYYYWSQPGPITVITTMPVTGGSGSWIHGGALGTGNPLSTQLSVANMTYTSGSAFVAPNGTPSTNNNVIGRFLLLGSTEGGVLQAVTVSLSGTRSGVNNVKLWSSTDNSFSSGSDIQLSSKTDGSSITFDSFNSVVDNSTGTYYFITMDLGAGASGQVTATIPSQASLTFAGANSPTSFTNSPLSSTIVPLPVELSSFSAVQISNLVTLNWTTATEVNNYGFEIQRSEVSSQKSALSNWEKIGFVNGNGNSNSPKYYSFTDNSILSSGNYSYRLKQIDNDGSFEYSDVVEVLYTAPVQFSLKQNYPNPFNPVTTISYSLPEKAQVRLIVFDVLGREVATLVNKQQESGVYNVKFDASNLNSGIYFYQLKAGNFSEVKKLSLLK